MSTTIQTYRYQYQPSSSSSSSSSRLPISSFSLSNPPRNTLPHHYLESSTNIFLLQPQSSTTTTNSQQPQPQPQQPEKIIIRQVGGPGDNHVQWVSVSEIIPYQQAENSEQLLNTSVDVKSWTGKASNGGGGVGKYGKRMMKQRTESYTSQVHGIVHTASWPNNDAGDRLWLRSDQPIIKGRRSVPVVNLDKGVSGEVCISHVTWHPTKRELSSTTGMNTTITFIGAEYRHGHGHSHSHSQRQQQRRGSGGGPFRMCVTQESGNGEGIIEMISLEELETCFEDVKPPMPSPPSLSSVHGHDHSHSHPYVPPPRPSPAQLQIGGLGDTTHISRQLRGLEGPRGPRDPRDPRAAKGPAATFDETDNIRMDDYDDNDDTLSQASFASSSTKGKVAMDLVALSLSIFNFNAAMLDLAALSNQSMSTGMGVGGFVRDIDEQPEAEDDSDEEDDEEGEEKVWSDCEFQASERQSVVSDEIEGERSRVEDSKSGSDCDM